MRATRGIEDQEDRLRAVFRDGEVLVTENVEEIRRRSRVEWAPGRSATALPVYTRI